MNALLKKEIHLLLPAFAATLALAILPIWLKPVFFFFFDAANDRNTSADVCCLGILMLAISSFGRETDLKTLPFMLTQPLERARIWWAKILVLALFVVLDLEAWGLSNILCLIIWPVQLTPLKIPAFSGLFVAVYTAGGLWMALLLRQTFAAFMLTVLIPVAIAMTTNAFGGAEWMFRTALGLFAVAAFFLAMRQFLRMQDKAWTGGVVSFGTGRTAVERSTLRERRPWAALFWKEMQLQLVTLVGMGCLLALHLIAVALRKAGAHIFNLTTLPILDGFGLLWLIMPLLAGSQSVAEERKFGTMQAHLCLPVSRRAQWFLKLMVVLVVGGLLSWTLCWAVEHVAGGRGADDFIAPPLVFLLLALAGFYGSTLTDGILPALATAAFTFLGFWASLTLIFILPIYPPTSFNILFLLFCIGCPALSAVLLWLSYHNFGNVSESWRLRWRNALALVMTMALTASLTAAIYHRAWEWLTPLEPPHGLARLSLENPPVLHNYGGHGLAVLLPDGKLWIDGLGYNPRWQFHSISWSEKWTSLGGNEFAPGSNWVDAATNSRETVAIRSDGTLWVSEKPRPSVGKPAGLIQFGQDTNWLRVTPHLNRAMFLFKRDGTLWDWGINPFDNKQELPSLRTFEPRRLGQDSDWARLGMQGRTLCAWKTDGSAWSLHGSNFRSRPGLKLTERELGPGLGMWRSPGLDNIRWRSLASLPFSFVAGIRDDGTLWLCDNSKPGGVAPVRIGKDSDWAEIVCTWSRLVARKTDGSLWKWDRDWNPEMLPSFRNPPVRLGTHSDWVALDGIGGDILSLAADGTLWSWPDSYSVEEIHLGENSEPLLAVSRKPDRIENIFDGQK